MLGVPALQPEFPMVVVLQVLVLVLASIVHPVGSQGPQAPGKSPYASRLPGQTRKGSTPNTEKSVLEGLRWLVRHQHDDGSWGAHTYAKHCSPPLACLSPDARVDANYTEGLTGLALLCFLGGGYTDDSELVIIDTAMGKQHRIGDVVKKGLEYLAKRQKPDGSFTRVGFMYSEALATMALCEAYGLTGRGVWKKSAEEGLKFVLDAQKRKAGSDAATGAALWGWRYRSRARIEAEEAEDRGEERRAKAKEARAEAERELAQAEAERAAGRMSEADFARVALAARAKMEAAERSLSGASKTLDEADEELHDADISVTTWAILALKSARSAGLDVPEGALRGGLDYARWVTGKDGLVGYQLREHAGMRVAGPNDHYAYHVATMSSLGMLVRTFVEHDLQDPFLEQAAKLIVRDLPVVSRDLLSIDYYYWYYASLALHQFDGPDSPRRSGKSGKSGKPIEYWDVWNPAMVEAMLALQDKSEERDVCTRGGWLTPDRWAHGHGDALYATAMSVLTLEVYYRFENAFRAAGAKKPFRR